MGISYGGDPAPLRRLARRREIIKHNWWWPDEANRSPPSPWRYHVPGVGRYGYPCAKARLFLRRKYPSKLPHLGGVDLVRWRPHGLECR